MTRKPRLRYMIKAAKLGRARKPVNVARRVERAQKYAALDADPRVQKKWRKYLSLTKDKGSLYLSKPKWYDLHYPKYKPKRPINIYGYGKRAQRVSKALEEFERRSKK